MVAFGASAVCAVLAGIVLSTGKAPAAG
jgi:hypothetical protein